MSNAIVDYPKIHNIIKERHPNYPQDSFDKLTEIYILLADQLHEFLTDYSNSIRSQSKIIKANDYPSLDVLNVNGKSYYGYTPYLDYRDEENFEEMIKSRNIHEDKSRCLSDIKFLAAKRYIEANGNLDEVKSISIDDVREIVKQSVNMQAEEIEFDVGTLSNQIDAFIKERIFNYNNYDFGFGNSKHVMTEPENQSDDEFTEYAMVWEDVIKSFYNLDSYDNERLLLNLCNTIYQMNNDLDDLEFSVLIDSTPIKNVFNKVKLEAFLLDVHPSELNYDCASISYLKNEVADLLWGKLDHFDGDTLVEKIQNRNQVVEDLFNNCEIDQYENGLIRILNQSGYTLDVLADFEKLHQIAKKDHYFLSEMDTLFCNDGTNVISNITYPIALSYEDYLFLNVARDIAKINDFTNEIVNEDVIMYDNGKQITVPFANVLEVLKKNELHDSGISLEKPTFELYNSNVGAGSVAIDSNKNIVIPLSSVYINTQEMQTIGSYCPSYYSHREMKPLSLSSDSGVLVKLEEKQKDIHLGLEFNNGLTDVSLEEILDKNIEFFSNLENSNKNKNKLS